MLKTVVLLQIFVETMIHFYNINIKLKRTAFIWKIIFIKVFTVTFVQCNASFMKSINFCPKLLIGNPIIMVMNTYTAIFRTTHLSCSASSSILHLVSVRSVFLLYWQASSFCMFGSMLFWLVSSHMKHVLWPLNLTCIVTSRSNTRSFSLVSSSYSGCHGSALKKNYGCVFISLTGISHRLTQADVKYKGVFCLVMTQLDAETQGHAEDTQTAGIWLSFCRTLIKHCFPTFHLLPRMLIRPQL